MAVATTARVGSLHRQTAGSRNEILGWILAVTASNFFGRLSMSVAGPEIKRDFGFSETQLGLVYGSFALAYAVSMVPAGWISDRFGPRVTMAAALAGMATVTAFPALYRPQAPSAHL